MDPEVVTLRPRSRAERAALTALLDLGELLDEAPIDVANTRVIGGHMVSLHVARAGLDPQYTRMTSDADVGFEKSDLHRLDLIDRFERRGYSHNGRHRFARPLELTGSEELEAVIDVLMPNYAGGRSKTQNIAGMELYKTPALATLLRRDPLLLEVHVDMDGRDRSTTIATTDERGALYSKVAGWEDRRRKHDADKDAFDIWRCLEVCFRAKVRPESWPDEFDELDWKRVLRTNFGDRTADGARALGRQLRARGSNVDQGVTRMRALIQAVIG